LINVSLRQNSFILEDIVINLLKDYKLVVLTSVLKRQYWHRCV